MIDFENDVIDIISAEYVDNHRIKFSFSDGHKQIVDFGPFIKKSLHPSVRKYLKIELFKQFEIIGGGVGWNDYEMCYPLEDLYNDTILKK